jgi:hypothetical protein
MFAFYCIVLFTFYCLAYYPGIYLEGAEENQGLPQSAYPVRGRNSNRAPPECENPFNTVNISMEKFRNDILSPSSG